MTTPELFITVNIDGRKYVSPVSIMSPVSEVPPVPVPPTKKLVIIHCVNWESLDNLPLSSGSVFSYFVLSVSASGSLMGISDAAEKKFVSDVHAVGKLPYFSIAGGAQNPFDIKTAVTTNRTAFLNNIAVHLKQYNFDGVSVDIENTSIPAQTMVSFIKDLRKKLDTIRPGLFVNLDVQPYQRETVWRDIAQAADAFDTLTPMLYDYPNTVGQIPGTMNPWIEKVGGDKRKLVMGSAVNYDTSGFDLIEWSQALDVVNAEGWGGAGIWNQKLLTSSYQGILEDKFPHIA